MNEFKVIVAHPGKQHSYRLAMGLNKSGLLYKYITTFYNKEKSLFHRVFIKTLSPDNRKRANSRKMDGVDDEKIKLFCQISGLIELILVRLDKKKKIYYLWRKFTSKRFGIKVAKYAVENKVDAVVCYDTNALSCFKYLEKKSPNILKILDSSAANRIYMDGIYGQDIEITPRFKEKLLQEIGGLLSESDKKYYLQEAKYSDVILVPSSFVKKSYTEIGIDDNKICVCPYGVSLDNFPFLGRKVKDSSHALNFIFVGGTKQLKGISYLLDAFNIIDKNEATLTIVGNNNLPIKLLKQYESNVNFLGTVHHSEISRILNTMDVMIFPSLGEGMSLSIIEAMSCGLPIICSSNSGANDLIDDGVEGFIIPIQNTESIIQKIIWFVKNREKIPQMGYNAHKKVSKYTWDNYYERIDSVFKDLKKFYYPSEKDSKNI